MPPNARIRLLFSLSAALPFSESSGHPVFSWRASVSCGHLLGLLFRALRGRVEEVAQGEGVATVQVEGPAGEDGGDGESPPQQTCSTSSPRQQPPTARKIESKPTNTFACELLETDLCNDHHSHCCKW